LHAVLQTTGSLVGARHNGYRDILRELADGVTGD
jgi:hypothetical protein